MQEMSDQSLASLHEQLHRCFDVVKVNADAFEGVLAECPPLLASLGNLAAQLRALQGVRPADTPLARFPAVQQRLRHKLSQAVDAVLQQLAQKVDALETARRAVSQHVSAAFQLYERSAAARDLLRCVARSAACPSIADMLEWLQDADRHYRLQVMQRRSLLQTLSPADLMSVETAAERWQSLLSPAAHQRITDALCQVSFCPDRAGE